MKYKDILILIIKHIKKQKSQIENVMHGNSNISNNVKLLTELVIQLNSTVQIQSMRINLLEGELDAVKNKKIS